MGNFTKITLGLYISFCGSFVAAEEITERPNVNNLIDACRSGREQDNICRALSNYKNYEKRSMEYLLNQVRLGEYEVYAASSLSILVNRRITLKRKSYISEKLYETIDIRPEQTTFSLEYNF